MNTEKEKGTDLELCRHKATGYFFTVSDRSDGMVRFYPLGGGFGGAVTEERFAEEFEDATEAMAKARPEEGLFVLGEDIRLADHAKGINNLPLYRGLHLAHNRWNGWVCPFIYEADAKRFVQDCSGMLTEAGDKVWTLEDDTITYRGYEDPEDTLEVRRSYWNGTPGYRLDFGLCWDLFCDLPPTLPHDASTLLDVAQWMWALELTGYMWHFDDSPASCFPNRDSDFHNKLICSFRLAESICTREQVSVWDMLPWGAMGSDEEYSRSALEEVGRDLQEAAQLAEPFLPMYQVAMQAGFLGEESGVFMTNPFVTCCGRFEVDPYETYGHNFVIWRAKVNSLLNIQEREAGRV